MVNSSFFYQPYLLPVLYQVSRDFDNARNAAWKVPRLLISPLMIIFYIRPCYSVLLLEPVFLDFYKRKEGIPKRMAIF